MWGPRARYGMPRAKKSTEPETTGAERPARGARAKAKAKAESPSFVPAEDVAPAPAGSGLAPAAAPEAQAALEGQSVPEGQVVPEGQAAQEGQAGPTSPDKKWYVVHTYSGYEGKVKANLEKRVDSMLMQDKIFRVIVPTEDEIEYKDGRKLISKKKIFPGYVLVEMVMNDDSWYVVRNTPGVTGFVGSGAKPVALDASEVKTILRHMGVDEPRPKVMYEDGESIKVINGPFMGFIGKVREVNLDKGKLRVFVSMFGRETPVELDFSQVEKL